jgi:hypothetical protein
MWEQVRLHLSRSGLEKPVELADLWTAYYLAAGKTSDAIARQMEVAELQPHRWLATARLCARFDDERALQLQPNLTDVANNFARLLAQGDSPDLPRSLAMIESAISKRPGDYRYRDTRGIIWMKMQRWDDALPISSRFCRWFLPRKGRVSTKTWRMYTTRWVAPSLQSDIKPKRNERLRSRHRV